MEVVATGGGVIGRDGGGMAISRGVEDGLGRRGEVVRAELWEEIGTTFKAWRGIGRGVIAARNGRQVRGEGEGREGAKGLWGRKIWTRESKRVTGIAVG